MIKSLKTIKIIIQVTLTTYIIYILIFVVCHFFVPNLEELNISSSSDSLNSKIQNITIAINKAPAKYYILIYEEGEEHCWLYSIHQEYDKHRQKIAEKFISEETKNYILLEGNKKNTIYTFQVQSKYPINYIAVKKNTFHVIYIVPYGIWPFPPFYYCLHDKFYINALN